VQGALSSLFLYLCKGFNNQPSSSLFIESKRKKSRRCVGTTYCGVGILPCVIRGARFCDGYRPRVFSLGTGGQVQKIYLYLP